MGRSPVENSAREELAAPPLKHPPEKSRQLRRLTNNAQLSAQRPAQLQTILRVGSGDENADQSGSSRMFAGMFHCLSSHLLHTIIIANHVILLLWVFKRVRRRCEREMWYFAIFKHYYDS